MTLPPFNEHGDLPTGIYQATLDQVVERFGNWTEQRRVVTRRLQKLYEIVQSTGKLSRFVIFGSYVTAKTEPQDVDIVLVMNHDFRERDYTDDVLQVFDHLRVQHELGASVFWIRQGAILLETVDEFLAYWQTKRDRSLRGIVELVSEVTK